MRPSTRLLLLVDAAAAAVAAVCSGWPPVTVPAGLLLGFVLPGAATVGALFPRRGLSGLERSVLSVALSLATLVLGGLGLHAVGVRLTGTAWAGLAGGVTVAGAVAAYLRTARQPDPAAPARVRPGRRLVPLALALALLGGAGWLSLASAARQTAATHVTALSITDSSTTGSTSGTRTISVEVTNQESTPTAYKFTVTGPGGFLVTLELTASKGSAWRHTVAVPTADRVTANLYRAGDTTPYRTVFVHGSVIAND
jgi:4-amino-4-deoxy-L-arabinose transferase-like glycosyltransferase